MWFYTTDMKEKAIWSYAFVKRKQAWILVMHTLLTVNSSPTSSIENTRCFFHPQLQKREANGSNIYFSVGLGSHQVAIGKKWAGLGIHWLQMEEKKIFKRMCFFCPFQTYSRKIWGKGLSWSGEEGDQLSKPSRPDQCHCLKITTRKYYALKIPSQSHWMSVEGVYPWLTL